MRHPTLKASSARPAQTPLVGCADDAPSLTSNTVALRHGVCRLQRFSGPTGPRTHTAAQCGGTAIIRRFFARILTFRLPFSIGSAPAERGFGVATACSGVGSTEFGRVVWR
jgi:hypothetical protein